MPQGPVFETNGPQLYINPTVFDMGDITSGQSASIDVTVKNVGDEICTIVSITSSDVKFVVSAVPVNIPANTTRVFTITCTPTGVGAISAIITIESDSITNPDTLTINAAGVAAGTIAISCDPAQWGFGEQRLSAGATAEKLFVIENTGTVDVTINAPTFTAPFQAGPTVPAYPVVVTPTSTLSFGIAFDPSVEGFIYNATGCRINSTAPTSPLDVPLSGEGILFTPTNILLGTTGEFIIGFKATGMNATVRKANPSNLVPETAASWEKTFDFWMPESEIPLRTFEKAVYRMFVYHEDLINGTATYRLTLTSKRGQVATQDVTFTGTNSGDPKTTVFDIKVTDEIIKAVFTPVSGPISIIMAVLDFDPQGQFKKGT